LSLGITSLEPVISGRFSRRFGTHCGWRVDAKSHRKVPPKASSTPRSEARRNSDLDDVFVAETTAVEIYTYVLPASGLVAAWDCFSLAIALSSGTSPNGKADYTTSEPLESPVDSNLSQSADRRFCLGRRHFPARRWSGVADDVAYIETYLHRFDSNGRGVAVFFVSTARRFYWRHL
jgi:hypothetical protein